MTLADQLGAETIDLHGYDVSGALFELDMFCERVWARRGTVRVVHGRGKGKLRQAILDWAKRQMDLEAADSDLVGETGAIIYIALKNKRAR